ncbi:MAG TPA: stage V sporulation protein D [Pseudogracilibacillus sp.]|nr:stage V sporulation protein D [Pseudogracilibacillus sp.]
MKRVSTNTIKKRMILVGSLFTILMVVMLVRLIYVQIIASNEIEQKAENLWLRDIPFEAERGKILDTYGRELTANESTPSLYIIPKQIKDKKEVAQKLATILDFSETKAYSYVTKNESIVLVHPEGRKLSEEKAKEISALQLEGVYLAKDTKRMYPYDTYLAHVLGFTGIDNQGLTGLESQYDTLLAGERGSLSYFSDAKGREVENRKQVHGKPKDGNHLQTTIDLDIQKIVERELDIANLKYNPDNALAIVVDPKNGAVLAIASRPNFSPANYQDVSPVVYNRNLPIWSTYEPGSTFKIITLAAALEEGLVDLEKDQYVDRGHIKVGNARLRCWKSGGHGTQTMLEVVENSCNPGFVHIGQQLGTDKLFSYIDAFGFGKKTGIDLAGEGTGILFKKENVGPVELATTAFGQGVSVTPIQQVMAVSAAVNGGYLYEPYIVERTIDGKTEETIEERKPKEKEQVISEKTSKQVRESLEHVVAHGTGRPAYVDGYRVGGKTGTAQKVGEDGRYMTNNYIVSFIGFAPADDPSLVVYLAIDNPKNTVQFGGVVAAPIVGKIIENSMTIKDIPRRKGQLNKAYQWPDEPKETIPNLIGLKKKDLQAYLSNLQIETYGKGDYIIDQEPKAGVKVEMGATMKVYFSHDNNRENN